MIKSTKKSFSINDILDPASVNAMDATSPTEATPKSSTINSVAAKLDSEALASSQALSLPYSATAAACNPAYTMPFMLPGYRSAAIPPNLLLTTPPAFLPHSTMMTNLQAQAMRPIGLDLGLSHPGFPSLNMSNALAIMGQRHNDMLDAIKAQCELHPHLWSTLLEMKSCSRRKGGQIRFTNDQTHRLEDTFEKSKYLTPQERKNIAKSLDLTERQVKTWFQNRRAKWRRVKQNDSPNAENPEMTSDSEDDDMHPNQK